MRWNSRIEKFIIFWLATNNCVFAKEFKIDDEKKLSLSDANRNGCYVSSSIYCFMSLTLLHKIWSAFFAWMVGLSDMLLDFRKDAGYHFGGCEGVFVEPVVAFPRLPNDWNTRSLIFTALSRWSVFCDIPFMCQVGLITVALYALPNHSIFCHAGDYTGEVFNHSKRVRFSVFCLL